MCSYTVQSQSNIESKCGISVCQYITLLKGGIHTMYCVKWKMTILFLYLIVKDYYILCIDIK